MFVSPSATVVQSEGMAARSVSGYGTHAVLALLDMIKRHDLDPTPYIYYQNDLNKFTRSDQIQIPKYSGAVRILYVKGGVMSSTTAPV